jgi:hypothetical protein
LQIPVREYFDSQINKASIEELAAVPNVTAMTGNRQTQKLKHKPDGGMSFSR